MEKGKIFPRVPQLPTITTLLNDPCLSVVQQHYEARREAKNQYKEKVNDSFVQLIAAIERGNRDRKRKAEQEPKTKQPLKKITVAIEKTLRPHANCKFKSNGCNLTGLYDCFKKGHAYYFTSGSVHRCEPHLIAFRTKQQLKRHDEKWHSED